LPETGIWGGIFGYFDFPFWANQASGGGASALRDAVAKPRDDRQKDLLRPGFEDIIDLGHRLVRLAREIDWQFPRRPVFQRVHAGSSLGCRPGWWRAVHPQAHAQPFGRGVVRALAGEFVLPILLRRIARPPRAHPPGGVPPIPLKTVAQPFFTDD
jgi:IS5 family transposase